LAFREAPSRRWAVSFVFGLVHGFGFASARRPLLLPRGELSPRLPGLHLGSGGGPGRGGAGRPAVSPRHPAARMGAPRGPRRVPCAGRRRRDLVRSAAVLRLETPARWRRQWLVGRGGDNNGWG